LLNIVLSYRQNLMYLFLVSNLNEVLTFDIFIFSQCIFIRYYIYYRTQYFLPILFVHWQIKYSKYLFAYSFLKIFHTYLTITAIGKY